MNFWGRTAPDGGDRGGKDSRGRASLAHGQSDRRPEQEENGSERRVRGDQVWAAWVSAVVSRGQELLCSFMLCFLK